MPLLVAIDPGKDHFGWAAFGSGLLVACGVNALAERSKVAEEVMKATYTHSEREVVCEVPRVYGAQKQKGDPNDLVDLAFSAGLAVEAFRFTFLAFWRSGPPFGDALTVVRPRDWKGQIPKPTRKGQPYVVAERVRARLDTPELKVVEAAIERCSRWREALDVVDAVGIGLWKLGRFGR